MPSPWTPESLDASRELRDELTLGDAPLPDGADLWAGRNGRRYAMKLTPEGYAVHFGLGCEGEQFNGPLACYHSKENSMTTKELTVRSDLVPTLIDFSDEQIKTIANVICVDKDGNTAPPAFVELFLDACRGSGLNPFLKQIYALKVQAKWQMYVGIDGYRVISERTGLDQGMDGPQWSDDGVTWFDYPMGPDPKFCRVGIWRKGVPRAYIAVVQMAAYRQNSGRWATDAPGMLAKCAEALARRRAFPANTAVIPKSAILEEPPEDAFPDAIDGSFWELPTDELSNDGASAVAERPAGAEEGGDAGTQPPANGEGEAKSATAISLETEPPPAQEVRGSASVNGAPVASPPPATPPTNADPEQPDEGQTPPDVTAAPAAPTEDPQGALMRKWAEVMTSDSDFQKGVANEILRNHRWALVEGSIAPLKAAPTDEQAAALLTYLRSVLPEPPST